MKKMTPTKTLMLTISILAIVLIIAGTVTFAFWGGNPEISNTGTVDTGDNVTYKYMIFVPNGYDVDEVDYRLIYNEASQAFLMYTYNVDDSATLVSTSVSISSGVTLIGYTGNLGEYETFEIPSSITYNSVSYTVNTIDLHMTEYDALKLITRVQIPSTVTAIKGVSFSGLENLTDVYFLASANSFTVAKGAFVGTNPTYWYRTIDASGNITDTSGVLTRSSSYIL